MDFFPTHPRPNAENIADLDDLCSQFQHNKNLDPSQSHQQSAYEMNNHVTNPLATESPSFALKQKPKSKHNPDIHNVKAT